MLILLGLCFNAKAQEDQADDTLNLLAAVELINTSRQDHEAWLHYYFYDRLVTKILDSAQAQLHKPYRYGAKGPNTYDCSGFTRYIYGLFDISLPASSRSQAEIGVPVEPQEMRPGDLIFFKGRNKELDRIGHVGIVIYASEDSLKFIHTSTRRGVTIDDLQQNSYYAPRYVTGRRVLQD